MIRQPSWIAIGDSAIGPFLAVARTRLGFAVDHQEVPNQFGIDSVVRRLNIEQTLSFLRTIVGHGVDHGLQSFGGQFSPLERFQAGVPLLLKMHGSASVRILDSVA